MGDALDRLRASRARNPVGSAFGRIVAAMAALAVIGAALILGLLFGALLLGGLLLAGLWYSFRGRPGTDRGATRTRDRSDSTVIDGEYTVVTDDDKKRQD